MNETTEPRCPKCGAPLAPGALGDSCPRCLLAANLATCVTGTGEPSATSPTNLPTTAPPTVPVAELAPCFPQFEILECLGRGGMGIVYKARQPRLNRLVALKVLSPERQPDPQFAERFAREAQALARLNHPSIVAIHDFGESGGYYYLLMEYVEGASLREVLRKGRLQASEALAIVPQICAALQYAHDQGVVHRDIKPENVLLDRAGHVKIADFGLAKIAAPGEPAPALTQERQIVGTPHYMAPEQIETPGRVDHRADLYSLGVVFYEMLTGELPLGRFQPPSDRAEIDARLDPVVLHALEKEPERRYQQASGIQQDVTRIASSPAGAVPPGHSPPRLPEPPRPGARPRPGRPDPQSLREWAWSLAVHGVLLALIAALLCLVVPRFVAIYQDMAAALPPATRWAIEASRFLQSYAWLLLPWVLAADAAIGYLLHAYTSRPWCRIWSSGMSLWLCLCPLPIAIALWLPLGKIVTPSAGAERVEPPVLPPQPNPRAAHASNGGEATKTTTATHGIETRPLAQWLFRSSDLGAQGIAFLDFESHRMLKPPARIQWDEREGVIWNDALSEWAETNHVSAVIRFEQKPWTANGALLPAMHLRGIGLTSPEEDAANPTVDLEEITPEELALWQSGQRRDLQPLHASWAIDHVLDSFHTTGFWTRFGSFVVLDYGGDPARRGGVRLRYLWSRPSPAPE